MSLYTKGTKYAKGYFEETSGTTAIKLIIDNCGIDEIVLKDKYATE